MSNKPITEKTRTARVSLPKDRICVECSTASLTDGAGYAVIGLDKDDQPSVMIMLTREGAARLSASLLRMLEKEKDVSCPRR